MPTKPSPAEPASLVESLAEFRFELRRFLHFSEEAASAAGLQPQQHQLLLQVAGARAGTTVTIAYAAKRLRLRHNSVVELVNRSVLEGLLVRAQDSGDLRRVLLQITPKGKKVASGVIWTSNPRFCRRLTSRRTCLPLARLSKWFAPRSW
jgi:DNA-binding MarR family transcriptional regulator